MAGSYPDVPSRRMAWDDDGCVCTVQSLTTNDGELTGAVLEKTPTDNVKLNSEADGQISGNNINGNGAACITVIFPELREVDGVYASIATANNTEIRRILTSGNTTNGVDGTYTVQVANYTDAYPSYPEKYRTGIVSLAVSNVRAVRIERDIGTAQNWENVHVYGEIAALQTPDRLLFVDATSGLEFGLPIDYGDVPRGSAEDRTFRLKNNSASLTAGSVQLTAEALYLGSGAWYTFNEGSGFQSTLPLAASIGAGAQSPTITLRRITPDTAQLGLHAARIQVSAGSWT